MKHTTFILLALASLLAVGCYPSGKGFEPYANGLTPDRVRAEMKARGCDYALIANRECQQIVYYGWLDSLLCGIVVYYDSDSIVGDSVVFPADAFVDTSTCEFLPLKGGSWRIKVRNRIVDFEKFTAPKVTPDGVAFDVKDFVFVTARCLFLSNDPALQTADLFTNPKLVHFLGNARGWFPSLGCNDEWDQKYGRYRDSVMAELEALGIDMDDTLSGECPMEQMGQVAKYLGFNDIKTVHSRCHDECTFHAKRTRLCDRTKCMDEMQLLTEMAMQRKHQVAFQHHGDDNGCQNCEITSGTKYYASTFTPPSLEDEEAGH